MCVVVYAYEITATEYQEEQFGVTKCQRKRSHYYVTKVYRDLACGWHIPYFTLTAARHMALRLFAVPGSKDLSFSQNPKAGQNNLECARAPLS